MIIANKLSFSLHFEQTGLSIPRLLAYNVNSFFYAESGRKKVTNIKELKDFLSALLLQNSGESIFVKPIYGSNGKGCIILNESNLDEMVEERGMECIREGCLYQEKITQHAAVNKIYPHSVNTIRFETYLDKAGKAHILSSFMRFGAGGNVVDNNGSGGFTAPVEMTSGRLKGMGLQPMWGGKGGGCFYKHPDTGFVLKDFEIPYFEEACQLTLEAVECLPVIYVEWDIAIAEQGSVIIEGNSTPVIKGGDLAYGGYLKNPLFKESWKRRKISFNPKSQWAVSILSIQLCVSIGDLRMDR